ncbi:hypothetical protein [Synechococcus sp. A15-28]|uniref:beta strand repeat-containing protein n=1 Tax=Synechococcus sp. A15-28 TaxID=1050638 RepID=UPI00164798E5|nr:hypothetical protein [Synechococcus sp. A15-28]QNI41144.1 Hypothetical protein SynA1528_00095 [Synechococcus sp. A15-28]
MANYLINSAGQVATGTDDAELFLVNTGAVSASTIYGFAGNDTLQVVDGPVASASSFYVDLAGGADVFTASAADFDDATIIAGAGGDKIVSHNSHFDGVTKLGDGSDTVTFSAGVIAGTLAGGAGADSIIASAVISGSASKIALGAGNDTMTFDNDAHLVSALIVGGGGNDSVTISGVANANSLQILLDDTNNTVDGNDTLSLKITAGSAVIKGLGGNDIITIENGSQLVASSLIQGNAGNDSIVIDDQFSADTNVTIGGGAGQDTIVMTGSVVVAGAFTGTRVNLGGGADSLNIDATTGGAFGTVIGGLGADSITFSSDLADTGFTMGQTIGFADFSDSTADGMDIVTFSNTDVTGATGGVTFNIAMVGLGSAETAGVPSLNSATIASGVATFSSVSAVSDRISKVDALLSTEGQYAVFTGSDASSVYLFVQGGTNDDIVTKFSNTIGGTITGLSTNAGAGSSFTIEINQA